MKVIVLPGDGIGPEVTAQAVRVLQAAGDKFGFKIKFENGLIGGAAIDASGIPLTKETLAACRTANAVLLGAVGGPKWDNMPDGKRPESGLLSIRKELELFANVRPARIYPELAGLSCLKPEIIGQGLDLVVIRELTGDVYFGQPAAEEIRDGLRYAYNTMIYNENEIRRIARVAFNVAKGRNGKVCSVDKANVLHVSRLWRKVVNEVHAAEFPELSLEHMYVDNAAMQLVLRPSQFDVILTGNLFGDILSDAAAAVVGSLGLLPSASLGEASASGISFGLYEPVHGSAPDIAGQDKANPLAAILSAAMLLRMSLGLHEAASAVEKAATSVLGSGVVSSDLARSGVNYSRTAGCKEIGDLVIAAL